MASTKAVHDRFGRLDPYELARKELFAEGISSSKIYLDPLRPSPRGPARHDHLGRAQLVHLRRRAAVARVPRPRARRPPVGRRLRGGQGAAGQLVAQRRLLAASLVCGECCACVSAPHARRDTVALPNRRVVAAGRGRDDRRPAGEDARTADAAVQRRACASARARATCGGDRPRGPSPRSAPARSRADQQRRIEVLSDRRRDSPTWSALAASRSRVTRSPPLGERRIVLQLAARGKPSPVDRTRLCDSPTLSAVGARTPQPVARAHRASSRRNRRCGTQLLRVSRARRLSPCPRAPGRPTATPRERHAGGEVDRGLTAVVTKWLAERTAGPAIDGARVTSDAAGRRPPDVARRRHRRVAASRR